MSAGSGHTLYKRVVNNVTKKIFNAEIVSSPCREGPGDMLASENFVLLTKP